MRATDSVSPVKKPNCFQLEGRYDDATEPQELTVFPPASQNTSTEWLTVDRSTVVALDQFE
jgi:hypothetical protein